MRLKETPEEQAFRRDLRAWLDEALPTLPPEPPFEDWTAKRAYDTGWQRRLFEAGYAGISWPEEYGGRGATPSEELIFLEETERAGAPYVGCCFVSTLHAGPTIGAEGTPEQRARYLPPILRGDHVWCQGFSEPEAGSDLASLRTRAVRDGDHYVVTGQKIWTTQAHFADWIFCLVRTDTKSDKRQEGISFLLIDMRTPGITVRPIILMDGGHDVNEVFFDEVVVPVENLVHDEGKGWTVAKYLLGHERMGTGRIGNSKRELNTLKEVAARQLKDGKPLMEDTRFRDRLTRVEVELMALEITNLRFLDQLRGGRPPGAEVSMLKIKGTEIQQALSELMMQAAGPFAQAFRPVDNMDFDHFTARLAARYCNMRKTSIYAGSNEIQRNIIAKMTLGL